MIEILWPQPRALLPLGWQFASGFPSDLRKPVQRGFSWWYQTTGINLLEERVGGKIVVAYGDFDPGNGDRARTYPNSKTVWFFRSWARLWWSGDYRRELFARHEGGHVLGLSHSDDRRSVMHPHLGDFWWLGMGQALLGSEKSLVKEYYR